MYNINARTLGYFLYISSDFAAGGQSPVPDRLKVIITGGDWAMIGQGTADSYQGLRTNAVITLV